MSVQVQNAVDRFNTMCTGAQAINRSGGSVDRIRLLLQGEPCDLLISADDAIIASMLMPEHTKGYYVFASNSMVILTTNPNKSITEENWPQVLLNPANSFGHYEPTGDPGGYRSVMVCLLADSVEPGLSRKLLEHPGRTIYMSADAPPADFSISYRSNAIKNNKPYIVLPESMNLSNPALNEHYATAAFDLDGDGKSMVYGSAICHALTIPDTAKEPELAMEFIKLFLQNDFKKSGFIPMNRIVGEWTGPTL